MKLSPKTTLKTIAASALCLVTFGSLVTSTVAWFKFGSDIAFGGGKDVPLEAGAEASYFESGTGTSSDPFIISDRIHLYNLAWLQYIGYFDGSTADQPFQPYFKLKNDIDMDGIVLPPIGTETYPFYGNFDGNGKTITNLTVSNDNPRNDSSDFGVMKPYDIPTAALQPNIVGFFGVIGALGESSPTSTYSTEGLTYSSAINTLSNVTLEDLTIQSRTSQTLIGLAAGYLNTTISGVMVDGESSINANKVNNVSPTALTFTENLSDYGLVGYSESATPGGDFTQKISEYYDSTLGGTDNDAKWGGSVDMQSLFQRMQGTNGTGGIRRNSSASTTAYPHVTTRKLIDRNHDNNYSGANEVYEPYAQARGNYPATMNYTRVPLNKTTNAGQTNETRDFRGNYNIAQNSSKIYFVGGTYQTDEIFLTSTGYHLTDGTHYLNSSLTNSTSGENNNTKWDIDTSTRKIRCYDETNRNWIYLTAGTRNTTTHIETITTTTNAGTATSWTISRNGDNLSIQDGDYRLAYIEGYGWNLYDKNYSVPASSYDTIISYGNNPKYYLPSTLTNSSGSYISTSTSLSGASSAELDFGTLTTSGQQATFHVPGDTTTTYYLYGRRSSNSPNYRIYVRTSTTTTNGYYPINYYEDSSGNKYLRSSDPVYDRYYVYLYYNGGWTVINNRTEYNTSYRIRTEAVSTPAVNFGNYYLNNTTAVNAADVYDRIGDQKMVFTAEDTTYFPLTVSNDAAGVDDEFVGKIVRHHADGTTTTTIQGEDDDPIHRAQYEPLGKNTGYYVSAMTGPQTSQNNFDSNAMSIILTEYDQQEKIGNSYDGTKIHSVQTIKTENNKNVVRQIADNDYSYARLAASKASLTSVLNKNTSDQVYGMHIDNKGGLGVVSMDNIVRAKNVRIAEKEGDDAIIAEYDEYDLPVYSIDCNLQEQGYINFLSGIYTGNNNNCTDAFFSLHEVTRGSDKSRITAIDEIIAIYADSTWEATKPYDKPYVYAYKDPTGQYDSVNKDGTEFDDDGLQMIFDSSWIGLNTDLIKKGNNGTGNNVYKNYIFYFEIPVNPGEYALGTVAGSERGSYMLYLDLGANGKEIEDRVYSYSITTDKTDMTYPAGVDFAVTNATGNGGDSICVLLPSGSSGEVSFNIDGNNITVGGDTTTIGTKTYSISKYSYEMSDVTGVTVDGSPPQDLTVVHERTRITYVTVVQVNQRTLDETHYYFALVNNVNEQGIVIDENGNPVYDSTGKPVVDGNSQPINSDPYVGDTLFYYYGYVKKNASGTVTESQTYTGEDAESDYTTVTTLVDTLALPGTLDSLRTRSIVITLVKASVTGSFDISLPEMPWTYVTNTSGDPTGVTYSITLVDCTSGMQIVVTYVNGELTTIVTIGGTSVTSGSTYTYQP